MQRVYRRCAGLGTGAVLCATTLLAPPALAAPSSPPAEPVVQVVVKVHDGAEPPPAASIGARTTATRTVEALAPSTYLVTTRARDARAAADAIERDRDVVYAEPNAIYRASSVVPNDPCFTACANGDQWYLHSDRAPIAWGHSRGASNVTVAVLDSAVKHHPDLDGKVTFGPDFSDHDDFCGTPAEVDHGTHVAGVIGAVTNNAAGVAGLGWRTRVLGVGVLNGQGCGTTASIVRGIRYAVAQHVRVINLSLGGPASDALGEAVRYAQANGVLVVAAAGNSGWTFPEYPAAYDGVLAVGATNRSRRLAPFSNRGDWVDIAAPGTEILSTVVAGGVATYTEFDGTSFAAPQVSATAALLAAKSPCTAAGDLAQRITSTARAGGSGGVVAGVLDAGAALTPPARGYRFASADGGVFTRGGTCFYGSAGNLPLHSPIVGLTSTRTDRGYWLVAADGGVFSYGDARFQGSAARLPLVRPIVAMEATPTGHGYWLVASDGGVFSFGDARFFGSTGRLRLHSPVLGMAATPTGRGYWLVAADGGVFSFGDARFFGSTGALRLASPMTGIAAAPTGDGYLLVGGDGGVFAFGGATYRGSASGALAEQPTTAIAMTHTGNGYWVLHADGSVAAFGDAPDYAGFPTFGAVAIAGARSG